MADQAADYHAHQAGGDSQAPQPDFQHGVMVLETPTETVTLGEFVTKDTFKNARQCHVCQETGHVANECSRKEELQKCSSCDEVGHAFNQCPTIVCYNCDRTGHIASECQEPDRCPVCRCTNHSRADCPHRSVNRKKGGCTICGDPGHSPVVCPVEDPPVPWCQSCRQNGHWVNGCTADLSLQVLSPADARRADRKQAAAAKDKAKDASSSGGEGVDDTADTAMAPAKPMPPAPTSNVSTVKLTWHHMPKHISCLEFSYNASFPSDGPDSQHGRENLIAHVAFTADNILPIEEGHAAVSVIDVEDEDVMRKFLEKDQITIVRAQVARNPDLNLLHIRFRVRTTAEDGATSPRPLFGTSFFTNRDFGEYEPVFGRARAILSGSGTTVVHFFSVSQLNATARLYEDMYDDMVAQQERTPLRDWWQRGHVKPQAGNQVTALKQPTDFVVPARQSFKSLDEYFTMLFQNLVHQLEETKNDDEYHYVTLKLVRVEGTADRAYYAEFDRVEGLASLREGAHADVKLGPQDPDAKDWRLAIIEPRPFTRSNQHAGILLRRREGSVFARDPEFEKGIHYLDAVDYPTSADLREGLLDLPGTKVSIRHTSPRSAIMHSINTLRHLDLGGEAFATLRTLVLANDLRDLPSTDYFAGICRVLGDAIAAPILEALKAAIGTPVYTMLRNMTANVGWLTGPGGTGKTEILLAIGEAHFDAQVEARKLAAQAEACDDEAEAEEGKVEAQAEDCDDDAQAEEGKVEAQAEACDDDAQAKEGKAEDCDDEAEAEEGKAEDCDDEAEAEEGKVEAQAEDCDDEAEAEDSDDGAWPEVGDDGAWAEEGDDEAQAKEGDDEAQAKEGDDGKLLSPILIVSSINKQADDVTVRLNTRLWVRYEAMKKAGYTGHGPMVVRIHMAETERHVVRGHAEKQRAQHFHETKPPYYASSGAQPADPEDLSEAMRQKAEQRALLDSLLTEIQLDSVMKTDADRIHVDKRLRVTELSAGQWVLNRSGYVGNNRAKHPFAHPDDKYFRFNQRLNDFANGLPMEEEDMAYLTTQYNVILRDVLEHSTAVVTTLDIITQARVHKLFTPYSVLHDEAGKAPEVSTLGAMLWTIPYDTASGPLKVRGVMCPHFLVGDFHQPSPMLGRNSILHPFRLQAGVSLFQRLHFAGVAGVRLYEQHRSNGHITALVNHVLPRGRMTVAAGVEERIESIRAGDCARNQFGIASGHRVIFVDCKGEVGRTPTTFSTFNLLFMLPGIQAVIKAIEGGFPGSDIAIMSPYVAQVHTYSQCLDNLAARLIKHNGPDSDLYKLGIALRAVDVFTVDKMQGSEKNVIIYCTTCAGTLGFTMDPTRQLLAISRAKSLLIIIASPSKVSTHYGKRSKYTSSAFRLIYDYCLSKECVVPLARGENADRVKSWMPVDAEQIMHDADQFHNADVQPRNPPVVLYPGAEYPEQATDGELAGADAGAGTSGGDGWNNGSGGDAGAGGGDGWNNGSGGDAGAGGGGW